MKIIVLEIKNKQAVIACSNGDIERVKALPGWEVGMELEYDLKQTNHRRFFSAKALSAVAAAAVLLFVSVQMAGAMNRPAAYVDIAINPAVRLSVNRFGNVIAAEGINEDGQALVQKISAKGELEQSVISVIHQAMQDGYIDAQGKNVHMTVSAKNSAQASVMERAVIDYANAFMRAQKIDANLQTQKIPMDDYTRLREVLSENPENAEDQNLAQIYRSGEWKGTTDDLWIEEIEYRGENKLELEFTKSINWTGEETVYALDDENNKLAGEILLQDQDEWIVQIQGITEGTVYDLHVLTQYGELVGCFRANIGQEFDAQTRIVTQSAAGEAEEQQKTNQSAMDDAHLIEELEYRGKGKVEIELRGNYDWTQASAYITDASGNQEKAEILEIEADEWILKFSSMIENENYTLILKLGADGLSQQIAFTAEYGFEIELSYADEAETESAQGKSPSETHDDDD